MSAVRSAVLLCHKLSRLRGYIRVESANERGEFYDIDEEFDDGQQELLNINQEFDNTFFTYRVESSSMDALEVDGMEAYADDTVLTDVLGDHPKTKILIALIGEADRDHNPTDIARLAGIDRSTFYAHIDDLMAYDLVNLTRTSGQSTMYQINKDSPATKGLAKLEWDLVEFLDEREQQVGLDENGRPEIT